MSDGAESEREPCPHPGETLTEDFLADRGLTLYRLAKEIRVPWTRLDAIAKGKRAISADTAWRLGRYFHTGAEFWLRLQMLHDLDEALTPELQAELAQITPLPVTPGEGAEEG